MFDLSGRVALVTGGNGGIGLGVAWALAAGFLRRRHSQTAAAIRAIQNSRRNMVCSSCWQRRSLAKCTGAAQQLMREA